MYKTSKYLNLIFFLILKIEHLYQEPHFRGALSPLNPDSNVRQIQTEINRQNQKLKAGNRKSLITRELRILEKMNKELEAIVEDRTQIFEQSKIEQCYVESNLKMALTT